MKAFILSLLALSLVSSASAQDNPSASQPASVPSPSKEVRQWTLQECIDHALTHNLTIQLREDNVQQQEIALSTSRNSRLPDLSGSVGESVSFGRALTANNTYANRNTQNTNFGLSTSVPLITGGRLVHDVRMKRLGLDAALADCDKAREDVTLNVMSAYLEAIYQKDLTEVAERQLDLSRMQHRRLQLLFDNQKASEADVAQARSAVAQDELALTQQHNAYTIALLALSQLLELPSPDGFDVSRPDASGAVEEVVLPSPEVVYSEAQGIKPQVLSEQLRLRSAEEGVKLARSALFPSLYFNAGLGSSYYKTSGFNSPSFHNQLRDNFSQYFGLSLSVPIFNRLSTRNNIRSARLQVHAQEIQLEETRKSLYKEIQQAYYNALAAQRQCASSDAALAAAQSAFSLMQRKYENGKASATEFQEAKTNVQRAEASDIQSRYTFYFRRRILEFYRTRL